MSSISLFFAAGIANLIHLCTTFLYNSIGFINQFSFASVDIPKPPLIFILFILIAIYLSVTLKRKYRTLIFLYLIIILVVLGFSSFNRDNNTIKLAFLDVGQGDAIYTRFPNGNIMLIDGGESSIYQDHGKRTVLPFLKHEGKLHVKYMVASHPHKDHISGLIEIIKTISVDTVVISPYRFNTVLYKDFLSWCRKKHIPIRYVKRGDQLYPDPDCRVYVLHPSSEFSVARGYSGTECNNSSIVLKIQYGDNGILLTGDIETGAEESLTTYGEFLECEVLKVAHHGGIHSSSMDILNYIQPIIGIISVAKKSRFNQPAALPLDRLRSVCQSIILTSEDGAAVFIINRKEIKRINWRKEHFINRLFFSGY